MDTVTIRGGRGMKKDEILKILAGVREEASDRDIKRK